jgi:hypothetical protein
MSMFLLGWSSAVIGVLIGAYVWGYVEGWRENR